jgi:hypothetical protein
MKILQVFNSVVRDKQFGAGGGTTDRERTFALTESGAIVCLDIRQNDGLTYKIVATPTIMEVPADG